MATAYAGGLSSRQRWGLDLPFQDLSWSQPNCQDLGLGFTEDIQGLSGNIYHKLLNRRKEKSGPAKTESRTEGKSS